MGSAESLSAAVERVLDRHAATFTAAAVLVVGLDGSSATAVNATAVTPFDLASLTKPFTAFAVLHAHALDLIDIDAPASLWVPEWREGAQRGVTVSDLLSHRSGLTAAPRTGAPGTPWSEAERQAFADDPWSVIFRAPFVAPYRTALYSDVGYLVLGRVLERATDTPLSSVIDRLVAQALGLHLRAGTCPGAPANGEAADGVVHDPAARALGGLAGHAGLFASATDVAALATALRHGTVIGHDLARDAVTTHARTRDGDAYGLGWMLPGRSSVATASLSPGTFGHTGFTGTSVFVDPVRDVTIVLLTNRVGAGASADDIRRLRADLHATVARVVDQRSLS